MSEYQYYEFQAIDRPLTEKEMGELRSYSTRARITSTSFVNDYSWGNFKGNEDAWMEKYFDAFLYLANWGTHVFKLRLPARLLDAKTARLYCVGERAAAREKNGKVILTFLSEEEEKGGDWVEGEGQLSSLISVRAELARGDLRGLYLDWLLCAQSGDLGDEDIEPPACSGFPLYWGVNVSSLRALVPVSGPAWRMSAAPFCRELGHSLALQRRLNRYLYVLMAGRAQAAACTRLATPLFPSEGIAVTFPAQSRSGRENRS